MADEALSNSRKPPLKERAFVGFKRFWLVFLYLWVVFGLLSIHKSLVMSEHHLDTQEHAFAFINAWVFAKVLLVGEHFNLGTRFSHKPLIYPILYKCFVFSVVLIFFHLVESVVIGVWHGLSVAESMPPLIGWSPKGVLAVSLMCFILLLPFFSFREIARVLGRAEMRALLLEPRDHEPRLT